MLVRRLSLLNRSLHTSATGSSFRSLFKTMAFQYEYARPAVTVDAALVLDTERPQILLIKRKNDPFAGSWALPGGFVDENEPLEVAAARELEEETSVSASALQMPLRQVETFGDPGRDPRGWTVTVCFASVVNEAVKSLVKAADDAAEAQWFEVDKLPQMAFDHDVMVSKVVHAVKDWETTPSHLSQALERVVNNNNE
jgi:8-oxo-dGTP diphosphatase